MKAILLAAGVGARLRPLTDTTPKCLVPIAGRPLLAYWLDLLLAHSVYQVLINVHHLADQVRSFLEAAAPPLELHVAHEEQLLGSAGTLRANRAWVGNEDVLIAYADNLTNANLSALLAEHRRHRAPLTMALFRAADPTQCGIAGLSPDGTVVRFEEKPSAPTDNLANAGIYAAAGATLDLIPDRCPADIAYDLLPLLIGRMRGWILSDYLIDIGSLERYRQAQAQAPRLRFPQRGLASLSHPSIVTPPCDARVVAPLVGKSLSDRQPGGHRSHDDPAA